MIRFKSLKLQNFLAIGNLHLEIQFERNPVTLVCGPNGSGKCLDPLSEIEIEFLDEEAEREFKKLLEG